MTVTAVKNNVNVNSHLRNTSNEDSNEDSNKEVMMWCPEQQIFLNGKIPSLNEQQVEEYIQGVLLYENDNSHLRIFGYGSLCWRPDGLLCHESVTKDMATALGYKRCWCQKSTDHRGTPKFPGIVCTLLSDEEVHRFIANESKNIMHVTEGVVYNVPRDLVSQLLEELDFREKGGYARDLIEVVILDENKQEKIVKALLYRGTPENPAFWDRAMMDLTFAAARMAVAVGPSGVNTDYLFQLDSFMRISGGQCPDITPPADSTTYHVGDAETSLLASKAQELLDSCSIAFISVCGSNQHNQILLKGTTGVMSNGDEIHQLTEVPLIVPRKGNNIQEGSTECSSKQSINLRPKAIYAGGGHSGLLDERGSLYLWGWNESGQVGVDEAYPKTDLGFQMVLPLDGISVEHASLGHTHTVLIENGSKQVYCFGDNGRGQVNGNAEEKLKLIRYPTTPTFLVGVEVIDVSAGVFHSAAITNDGYLITWGCSKFNQSFPFKEGDTGYTKWKPVDGSKLLKVACGYKHTVVIDEHGRVWTMGNNKFYQLGREESDDKSREPKLVDGILGEKNDFKCLEIFCGWSHSIVKVQKQNEIIFYGWGRNDKGQLGVSSTNYNTKIPTLLFDQKQIVNVDCGAESTFCIDIDGFLYSCGWNEHGNLSSGKTEDLPTLKQVRGQDRNKRKFLFAGGGAHFLVIPIDFEQR